MPALSERKMKILQGLVEASPDRVVGALQAALAETGEESTLAGVRGLVDQEARDRALRNAVLAPVAPMCVGDGKDPRRLAFPARVLGCLWRGVKAAAREGMVAAAGRAAERPGDDPTEHYDSLVRLAATGLRNREPPHFREAAELCDTARPGGAGQLAACLDLAPVVRQAIPRLADWTGHFGEDTTAAARLAYKDAVAVADDGGKPFFEMLSAHLPYPWVVLRVISAVMDKPTERYLADSEMAGFGELLMSEIDDGLDAVARLDANEGPALARAAGKRVELITVQTSEMEACVDLSREHGWGHRLVKQKNRLASIVEAHLRNAEKLTALALPTQPAKLARVRRNVPRLETMPDPLAVARAMTLLNFVEEIRSSANYGGFAAARRKLLETLGEQLDGYVDEVVDHLRTGDIDDDAVGYAYLEVAAELSLLLRDEKAAELVRRRAAALRRDELAATLDAKAS